MSLPHMLLGILSWRPLTGYELKKFMDNSTQFFWHAELSQIYPALKQLEGQGLITAEAFPQENKPDKKIYATTQAGRHVLIAWLNEPLDEIPPIKNPALLKLFFSGILSKEEILSQLRFQLEAHRARLKRIQQEVAAGLQEAVQASSQAQMGLLWELVRQYGELQEQMTIEWLKRAITIVEAYDAPGAKEALNDQPTYQR
jgi:PadR family transcriptional regulator AphA